MKKVQYIVSFLIIAATLLISCQKNKRTVTADEIGTYAFNLLSNIENTTEQEYIEHLYTFGELRAYAKKNADSLVDEMKQSIAVMTKDNYDARSKRDLKTLKNSGASFQIDWSTIEPVTFKYWPRAKNGIHSIKGDLYFTHNQENYKIIITAFDTGDGFIVSKIENLQKIVEEK
ncbi:hypothetical protein [uncultured Kordia sp.]|uniref:hypothetical protein n=1 Tax=uncultured Kordia sp. TaxID=507699 RepID=UPI00260AFD06|nr:hypothetical protein [uncultured Kordia sp.]